MESCRGRGGPGFYQDTGPKGTSVRRTSQLKVAKKSAFPGGVVREPVGVGELHRVEVKCVTAIRCVLSRDLFLPRLAGRQNLGTKSLGKKDSGKALCVPQLPGQEIHSLVQLPLHQFLLS